MASLFASSSLDPGLISHWSSYVARTSSQGGLPSPEEVVHLFQKGLGELVLWHVKSHSEAALGQLHGATFWSALAACSSPAGGADGADGDGDDSDEECKQLEQVLLTSLQGMCQAVAQQCAQLAQLCQQLVAAAAAPGLAPQPLLVSHLAALPSQHRCSISAMLMASAPFSLTDMLQRYFSAKLAQLSEAYDSAAEQEGSEEAGEEGQRGQQGEDMMQTDDENTCPQGSGGQAGAGGAAGPAVSPSALLGAAWVSRLQGICSAARSLELQAAAEEAYTAVVHSHVSTRLTERARGVFDREVLSSSKAFVTRVPYEFLKLAISAGSSVEQCRATLEEWKLRLTYSMYETLGQLRISEMFDIVVDYPDSLPACRDTAECLRHTNLRRAFVTQFRRAVQQRLLHAGAATTGIIHQYVSSIRALRGVDPSGSLLAAVAPPIRAYLRQRSDTIRCIVSMLTEDPADGSESLLEEVAPEEAPFSSEAGGDEAALKALRQLGAQPGGQQGGLPGGQAPLAGGGGGAAAASGAAGADIVKLLIGIYGSKELFVDEYKRMLAGRLLARSDYQCEREIRTLELLKLRFGETTMHHCEVMLKDLADAKRINTTVSAAPPAPGKPAQPPAVPGAAVGLLSASLISHLFWPEAPEAELLLPPDVQAAMEEFGRRYHTLKAPRRVNWHPSLGVVELELEVAGTVIDFKVTPLHATMLLQFETRERISAAELASLVGVPQAAVRKRALFWVNNGVLAESRIASGQVVYSRATALDPARATCTDASELPPDDDPQAAAASDEERLLTEMSPYENYIIGMLTNFASLTLERLHNMLRMFVISPKYDKSQEQLADFLAHLVGRERVAVEGALYKRKKTG